LNYEYHRDNRINRVLKTLWYQNLGVLQLLKLLG